MLHRRPMDAVWLLFLTNLTQHRKGPRDWPWLINWSSLDKKRIKTTNLSSGRRRKKKYPQIIHHLLVSADQACVYLCRQYMNIFTDTRRTWTDSIWRLRWSHSEAKSCQSVSQSVSQGSNTSPSHPIHCCQAWSLHVIIFYNMSMIVWSAK